MKYKLKVKIQKGEFWYGGNVALGSFLPISRYGIYRLNDISNLKYNQSAPLFLSNKGRYIWSEDGFITKAFAGFLRFESNTAEIKLYEGYNDLRGAYLAAQKAHFPTNKKMPPETMFIRPQYCTWIELLDNQNQKDIIDYAKSIIKAGMPTGEIIIDDGWQKDFGEWEFREDTFPDPKKMIEELHELGFTVSLWTCPFVTRGVKDFDYLVNNNCLVKDKDGNIADRKWWNGVSTVLDLTNDKAKEWFMNKCNALIKKYDVRGFKQDAGDALYYRHDDITTKPTSPNGQSELWAKLAHEFKYNELRACWKCGGEGIVQRLSDKPHKWIKLVGLRSLIPNMLVLGLLGHPFSCPDMIGGGYEIDFAKPEEKMDHELFVRSAQCAALMPMMQYSKSIWRLKREDISKLCIEAAEYHKKFQDVIIEEAKKSAESGEPILRYLEYEFPNQKLEKNIKSFMLGSKYLVAPILHKGAKSLKVQLPQGKWKEFTRNEVYEGGKTIKLKVDLSTLPIFEKID